jgi:hypothetical protein
MVRRAEPSMVSSRSTVMKRHEEYLMEKERPATPQLNRVGCQLSYRDIISNSYSGQIQRD